MQRGLVFLVLAALFLAYAHAALLPPFPAPAIFWSNQRSTLSFNFSSFVFCIVKSEHFSIKPSSPKILEDNLGLN